MHKRLVLDPADFGTCGLTLYHLIGIAIVDPNAILPRQQHRGRGAGMESMKSWQSRAVNQVLADNGVDVHVAATGPMVKETGTAEGSAQ